MNFFANSTCEKIATTKFRTWISLAAEKTRPITQAVGPTVGRKGEQKLLLPRYRLRFPKCQKKRWLLSSQGESLGFFWMAGRRIGSDRFVGTRKKPKNFTRISAPYVWLVISHGNPLKCGVLFGMCLESFQPLTIYLYPNTKPRLLHSCSFTPSLPDPLVPAPPKKCKHRPVCSYPRPDWESAKIHKSFNMISGHFDSFPDF